MKLSENQRILLLCFVFFGLPILWIFPPTARLIKLSGEQRELRQVALESISDILDTCGQLNRTYTPSNKYTLWREGIRAFRGYGEWYEWRWEYYPRIRVFFQPDESEEYTVCEALPMLTYNPDDPLDNVLYYTFSGQDYRNFCEDSFSSENHCFPYPFKNL